jgi:catechol 2,3-dioxygenase-like lactoylglutathione lyase family enzyme
MDMLGNAPVTVILPVLEMQRAREFYEHKLGLHPQGPGSDGMFLYTCGNGAVLGLSPRETGTKAEHTALSFEVKDIESTIAELESNGVEFAEYDLPGLKTVNHVCVLGSEKAAWFNDPEGNILCLHEVTAQ